VRRALDIVHVAAAAALAMVVPLAFVGRVARADVAASVDVAIGMCVLAVVVSGAAARISRIATAATLLLLVLDFAYVTAGGAPRLAAGLCLFAIAAAYAWHVSVRVAGTLNQPTRPVDNLTAGRQSL
jgi:hypothetical protein